MKLNVLYEDNHIIVCLKEPGILSQKDASGKPDILTLVKEYVKEEKGKPGEAYIGLVHRLDQRVGGVMVFAKTSKAASRLSESIRNHEFKKNYCALVLGKTKNEETLIDYLDKEDKKAIISNEGKESILKYYALNSILKDNKIFSYLKVELITGRYNQIRKQLSYHNMPIINDFKYGYEGKNYNDELGLWCYQISFLHPVKKEIMTFRVVPRIGIWEEMNLNE